MKKEKKDKKTGQKKEGTRQLIGIQEITDYSLRTMEHGELVFFLIHPSNLSVLSESSLAARIYGLMTVLKGMAELEMLCLNSKENFEDNKKFIQDRVEEEENSAIRKLLEADLKFCTASRYLPSVNVGRQVFAARRRRMTEMAASVRPMKRNTSWMASR